MAVAQGVAVVGIARQGLGVQHELAARGAGVGGDDRDLDAELVGRAGLALADALDLRGVEGIELPAALALLLGADLGGPRERALEGRFEGSWPRSCGGYRGSAGPGECAGSAVRDGGG